MKNTFILALIVIVPLFIISCFPAAQMSRIIKQTEDSAMIQGVGMTKYEAKIHAEEKAKKIFINYSKVNEEECTQEYSAYGSGNSRTYSAHGSSYWSCIISVEKR